MRDKSTIIIFVTDRGRRYDAWWMGNLSSKRLPWSYYSLSNCLDDMPSSTSEDRDDIAECAAAFLQSKQCEVVLGSFLDAHCILFVGDATDDQIEHTRLHGEYADLVQKVLQQRLWGFNAVGVQLCMQALVP